MKERDELQGSGMPPACRLDCYASRYTTAQPPYAPLFSAAKPPRKEGGAGGAIDLARNMKLHWASQWYLQSIDRTLFPAEC
ncbi:hypothetical protein SH449x_000872 [Pirellulaceae bacterium SH449]